MSETATERFFRVVGELWDTDFEDDEQEDDQ